MNSKSQIMDSESLSAEKDLRYIFNLLPRKGITVLAGAPGTGKSTFALNLIESALLNNPSMSALIFSLEKSSKWVLDLMARSMSGIAAWKFKPENLVGTEAVKFKKARQSIEKLPLLIRDGSHSVKDICATARTVNNIILKQSDEKPLNVILIDYLENIEPSCKSLERVYQVREAMASLKALSEELEVPIILLAKLNRKNFYEPKVDNLIYASEIKKYADTVALLGYKEIPTPNLFEVKCNQVECNYKIRLDIVNLPENSGVSIPLIFKRSSMRYIPDCESLC